MVQHLPCRRRQPGRCGSARSAELSVRGAQRHDAGAIARLPVAPARTDARSGIDAYGDRQSDRLYRKLALIRCPVPVEFIRALRPDYPPLDYSKNGPHDGPSVGLLRNSRARLVRALSVTGAPYVLILPS